jgi:Uma2 family endonuclease
MITDIRELNSSCRYTYADYLKWQFDELVELIRGQVFRMSPAPNTAHQTCASNIHGVIWNHLRTKSCKVFTAPFDVRLKLPSQTGEQIDTVVQPDLCVICDESKLDVRGCMGPPDWIIEILSESTAQKDLTDKFELYQEVGVREYWVVHPAEKTVLPYYLADSCLYALPRPNPFTENEKIPVYVFKGFIIDAKEIFH